MLSLFKMIYFSLYNTFSSNFFHCFNYTFFFQINGSLYSHDRSHKIDNRYFVKRRRVVISSVTTPWLWWYLSLREECPNTELFLTRILLYSDWVNLCIQSEYRKIRTRNNSVFGHFSRSVCVMSFLSYWVSAIGFS